MPVRKWHIAPAFDIRWFAAGQLSGCIKFIMGWPIKSAGLVAPNKAKAACSFFLIA